MNTIDEYQVVQSFTGKEFNELCESIMREQLSDFNEKYVLKVGNDNGPGPSFPQPPIPPQPPMPPMGGGMGPQEPPMEDMPGDTNLDDMPDDGDEGDGGPRKDIEKATGKLAQDLREYCQGNQDANELCKYVLGMIVSAAAGSLSDNEKQEVIKKLNKTGGDEPASANNNGMGQAPGMGNQQPPRHPQAPQGQPGQEQPMNELLSNMEGGRHADDATPRDMGTRVSRKRPFTPKF